MPAEDPQIIKIAIMTKMGHVQIPMRQNPDSAEVSNVGPAHVSKLIMSKFVKIAPMCIIKGAQGVNK